MIPRHASAPVETLVVRPPVCAGCGTGFLRIGFHNGRLANECVTLAPGDSLRQVTLCRCDAKVESAQTAK